MICFCGEFRRDTNGILDDDEEDGVAHLGWNLSRGRVDLLTLRPSAPKED